jgi:hypothetical protein
LSRCKPKVKIYFLISECDTCWAIVWTEFQNENLCHKIVFISDRDFDCRLRIFRLLSVDFVGSSPKFIATAFRWTLHAGMDPQKYDQVETLILKRFSIFWKIYLYKNLSKLSKNNRFHWSHLKRFNLFRWKVIICENFHL